MQNHAFLSGTLTAFVISAAAATAQPPAGGSGEEAWAGRGRFERAAEYLELTDDQRTQLHAAFEQYEPERSAAREQMREQRQALRKLMEGDAPDPTAIGQAMLAIEGLRKEGQARRKSHQETFKSLLTPEQLRKWELVEASRVSREHSGRRSRHGRRGPHSSVRSAPSDDQG